MLLITLLATTLGPSHGLPTDPLDVAALDKLNKLNMLSGTNYCAFDNGTRTSHLPPEFFGPEPCVFQSEMVLRANGTLGGKGAAKGALVWGFAPVGTRVTLAINGDSHATMKGGPAAQTLIFTGSSKKGVELPAVTLNNVLFGAVFLCSGQSNMDFSVAPWGGGGCLDANATVAAAASGKLDDIRLKKSTGSWFNSSTPGMIKKNVPGYADIPIGLMQSSVGGTVIEEWMSTNALEACLPANESMSHAKCAAGSQENSELYYKMVDPLAPSSLTGALWYQGESNVAQNWHPTNASWPFNDYYGCLFKSKNSVLALPNTGVALALDLGDNGKVPVTPGSARHGGIHPRNKTEVARRMALAFAATGLDLPDVIATGPVFVSAAATSIAAGAAAGGAAAGAAATVTVSFSNVDGGVAMSPTAQCCLAGQQRHAPAPNCSTALQAECCPEVPRNNNTDSGVPFEVLDSRTNEYVLAAKTTVSPDGNSVVLEVPAGVNAVGVRYCEQGYPQCVLRNGAGLPALPFVAKVTSAEASTNAE
eukprot:gene16387-1736_t